MISEWALLSVLLLAAPALQPANTKTAKTTHSTLVPAGELAGLDILNIHGEKVAEVRDARIDLETGQVAWVIVQSTNVLEVDETTYAIPWVALEFEDGGGDSVTLNIDPSKMMAVSQRLYYMTDEDFARAIDDHYGLAPTSEDDRK